MPPHPPESLRARATPAARAASAALLLAAAVLPWSAPARADIPPELVGRRIAEVRVAGETAGLTPVRDVGIPPGAALSRTLLRAALANMVASGRWADVQLDVVPTRGEVVIVAHLVPRLFLTRIEVRGNDVMSDAEVGRAMELAAGAEIEAATLPALAGAVEAAYAEKGYERTEVSLVLRDTDDPSRKVLIVEVTEGRPTRIRELRFEGEAPPRGSRVERTMGVSVGDILDRRALAESVRRAQSRLRRRGWLQALLGDPLLDHGDDGVVVRIPSYVGPRFTLEIRGHAPLERGDVESVLDVGEERLTGAAMTSMEQRVTDLYATYGFEHPRVRARAIASHEPGEAFLRLEIDPGPRLSVVAIAFPGAHHFERSFLTSQLLSYLDEDLPGGGPLATVDSHTIDQIGLGGTGGRRRTSPRPIDPEPARVFYAPTYEEAIEHIQEIYQAEGFLSARVGPARPVRMRDQQAIVEVPVVEGPRSMLHEVVLRGNVEIGSRELLSVAGLERGAAFSHLALEQARLAIEELYRERGFLFAEVEPSVRFSGDRTRAQVLLEIEERFPVHVGEIVVRGARRTSEALIRSIVRLRPGDLYKPTRARASQDLLMELGIFSGVTISPEDPDLPARIKSVVVTVTERGSQVLDGGGGVSTGQGVRGVVEYRYRNLLGYAIGVGFRVQLAHQFFFLEDVLQDRFGDLALIDRLERRITGGVVVPHIPGLPRVRASLDLVHLRENERSFGLDKNSIGLAFTYRPHRRVSLALAESLENNDVDLLTDQEFVDFVSMLDDPRLERLLRVPEGGSTLVATRTDLTFDLRDNPFVPTRGGFASVTAEYARTLSTEEVSVATEPQEFESNHFRVALTASGYLPIGDKLVLATQVRLGRVFHVVGGSETYPNRQFFLGGVDTLRGFLQDSLIPQDVAEEIAGNPELVRGAPTGGDVFILYRSELRFPLAGDLHAGVFADVGNLWSQAGALNPIDVRPTAGLGLRVATPVGPLAFDYGFNLLRRRELDEPFGAFHFSIGLF